MHEDFVDLLAALISGQVRFLVVGAHALAIHGASRATEDLDILVDRSPENAASAYRALLAFGAPLPALGVTIADLERADQVIQIGLPPRRIDVMTGISGVSFEDAWNGRVTERVSDLAVPFLGRDALIVNKRASGRPKDLQDIEALEE